VDGRRGKVFNMFWRRAEECLPHYAASHIKR
jgi:hypothetical protein